MALFYGRSPKRKSTGSAIVLSFGEHKNNLISAKSRCGAAVFRTKTNRAVIFKNYGSPP